MRYYDLQRLWTRKIEPHLTDERLNAVLVRGFNKFTLGNRDKPRTTRTMPRARFPRDVRFAHDARATR